MVGQIQILTYLLCIYLIYKGYEIFQAAYLSTSDKRKTGLVLGTLAFVGSILIAIGFIVFMEFYVADTFNTKSLGF